MNQVKLGSWGPEVSEICFGSLAISPLQGRVTEAQGTEVLKYAFEQGINWLDTAEIYDNYGQIAQAIKGYPQVRIISKSYAVTEQDIRKSLEKARSGLNRDCLDFFLLHEQESALTLKGHSRAWEELLRAKEKGMVRWIGISTHAVEGVRAGALQPGLDVIHPILNFQGLGIIDGSLDDMLKALSFAAELGIGIYAMKVFGGGHLSQDPQRAVDFVRRIPGVQAMALGMSSQDEVDYNLLLVSGQEVPGALKERVRHKPRKLYIADWCQGCGRCVEVCPQKALQLEETAVVDHEACVLCGYCGRVCPHFCLKIV
ncbi:putative oxidoreductase, aryl-alcohol dehydrogenase like protein [Desulfosporosinus acidiphilus SJ4]|uniref:Putative oxidoreductase, aryl-alcohol dehydrogenase like protein n=1 Tax=Desulfosporosinus acidiphilus (strain DSM 22704 / JCM 16185 / SJ4) TaxID=646529 RepID=I4D966_DESAJ|nr:aldo/keto reductase [Desulfosporosinus acidiphilus]AFM42340.1 putative oxidoreductase, aryl-alcohol dehydrogenase like protein [Desulfosporosinus acidiphilus SJ4]